MPAFQVKIAYLTKYKQSRHLFHELVIADDAGGALDEGRKRLARRSRETRIIHEACSIRPDSEEVERAAAHGWTLNDNWWSRPVKAEDDLAAIARHGFTHSNVIHAKSAQDCVAIDRHAA